MLNITQKITHENFCVEHNTKNDTQESFVLAITALLLLLNALNFEIRVPELFIAFLSAFGFINAKFCETRQRVSYWFLIG